MLLWTAGTVEDRRSRGEKKTRVDLMYGTTVESSSSLERLAVLFKWRGFDQQMFSHFTKVPCSSILNVSGLAVRPKYAVHRIAA